MTDITAGTTTPPGMLLRTGKVIRELMHRPRAAIGLIIIIVMVLAALFAPWIMPHDPFEQSFDGLTLEGAPLPPNADFWFGTDLLGVIFSPALSSAPEPR